MADFISRRLGKGIVYAKDTPNFIGNRIGVYAIYKGIQHMIEMGMTVEEVDSVAGPATARPKSGAFRTADMVGLDTLAHVGNNSYELLPEDEEREVFKVPAFMRQDDREGLLGNKTKKGFIKRSMVDGKTVISYYDWPSGEYKPAGQTEISLGAGWSSRWTIRRRKSRWWLAGNDKGAEFAWKSLRDTLIYAFNRIPEIADDVVNIDNAMKWGFNWEIGPFEMLDAIGVAAFIKRAEKDGVAVPEAIEERSNPSTATPKTARKEYYDLQEEAICRFRSSEGQIRLEILKRGGRVVEKNANSSIIDLGDGVFGFEFHSKMNAISGDILSMTHKADQTSRGRGRRAGDRQPGRQLLGGRQPDDAGRRPGRGCLRGHRHDHPRLPEGDHGGQICQGAGGGSAV